MKHNYLYFLFDASAELSRICFKFLTTILFALLGNINQLLHIFAKLVVFLEAFNPRKNQFKQLKCQIFPHDFECEIR